MQNNNRQIQKNTKMMTEQADKVVKHVNTVGNDRQELLGDYDLEKMLKEFDLMVREIKIEEVLANLKNF